MTASTLRNRIEHHGGCCPVDADAQVHVWLHGGQERDGRADDFRWPWGFDGIARNGHIIAYAVDQKEER